MPEELRETEPLEATPEHAIARVLRCHPELANMRAKLAAAEVALKLANNQVAPELDLKFQVSRDLGDPTGTPFDVTLPGTVFDAGFEFTMPLALREERGKLVSARAKVRATQADVDLLEDRLRLRTGDAGSDVAAAQERVGLMDSVVDKPPRSSKRRGASRRPSRNARLTP